MSAVTFTQDDADELELVRKIILLRLKEDPRYNQMYRFWSDPDGQRYVTFDPPQLSSRFEVLEGEVLWQLIIQGVITPGINSANPALPCFRITGYGKKVLEEERFLPHDPTGYLDKLSVAAKTVVGHVALGYVQESLRCFTTGCNLASVLLLGVAAEAVFLKLCDVVENNLANPNEQTEFQRRKLVKRKHRWLSNKYESLSKVVKNQLPESLDITLNSLYDLIRRQRNELGHPQEQLPHIDREKAFMFLTLFPTFVTDVEAFAEYCRNNNI